MNLESTRKLMAARSPGRAALRHGRGIALGLFLVCTHLSLAAPRELRIEGDSCRLTLDVHEASLEDVLQAVEQHLGMKIEARGTLDRNITARYIDRSVDDVLGALGLSFVRICVAPDDVGHVAARTHEPPVSTSLISMRIEAGVTLDRHEYSLLWPTDLSPAAHATLKAFLAALLQGHGADVEAGEPADMVRAFAAGLQREQEELLREFPDSSLRYSAALSTGVEWKENDILSMSADLWVYTGGAHGNTYDRNIILDLRTGQTIGLRDLFKAGTDEQLTDLIKDQLRVVAKLGPDSSLADAGFQEDEIKPSENVFLSKRGIGFEFNPYDIAPYAMGSSRAVIPFEELRALLNPAMVERLMRSPTSSP